MGIPAFYGEETGFDGGGGGSAQDDPNDFGGGNDSYNDDSAGYDYSDFGYQSRQSQAQFGTIEYAGRSSLKL
jgi:hypothetical protein